MLRFLLTATCLIGCNDYYLDKTDPPPPPPLDAEDCTQVCEDWGVTLGPIGCDVKCGVTAYPDGTLVDGIVDLGVVDDGGNHCTLSVTCPDAGVCQNVFTESLAHDEDIDAANDQFNICQTNEDCSDDYDTCMTLATTTLDACVCSDIEDQCKGGEGIVCDEDSPPPLPPPPVQTGPSTWSVPRAWVNFQVAHFAALHGSTPYWPVRGPNGAFIGVQVADIRPGSPLHAVGIRDRDLLRSANGVGVIAAMRNPALLDPLRTASVISLTLTRNGAQRVLTYNVH